MDWQAIVMGLLTVTFPAVLTYFVTKKNADNELNKSKNENVKLQNEITILEMQIAQINQNHRNELEKLEFEHNLRMTESSENTSNEFARKFITGDLNLDNMSENIRKIPKIQKNIEKLNFKKGVTDVVNKRKSK